MSSYIPPVLFSIHVSASHSLPITHHSLGQPPRLHRRLRSTNGAEFTSRSSGDTPARSASMRLGALGFERGQLLQTMNAPHSASRMSEQMSSITPVERRDRHSLRFRCRCRRNWCWCGSGRCGRRAASARSWGLCCPSRWSGRRSRSSFGCWHCRRCTCRRFRRSRRTCRRCRSSSRRLVRWAPGQSAHHCGRLGWRRSAAPGCSQSKQGRAASEHDQKDRRKDVKKTINVLVLLLW